MVWDLSAFYWIYNNFLFSVQIFIILLILAILIFLFIRYAINNPELFMNYTTNAI